MPASRDRDRPTAGVIWTFAFVALTALTVWKFEMWPTGVDAPTTATPEVTVGDDVAVDVDAGHGGPTEDPFFTTGPKPFVATAAAELTPPPLVPPPTESADDLVATFDQPVVRSAAVPTDALPVESVPTTPRTWDETTPWDPPAESSDETTPNVATAVASASPSEAEPVSDPFFADGATGWVVVDRTAANSPAPAEPPAVEPPAPDFGAVADSPSIPVPSGPDVAPPAAASAPYLVVGPKRARNVEPTPVVTADATAETPPAGKVTVVTATNPTEVPARRDLLTVQLDAAERLATAGEFAAAHEILTRLYWSMPEARVRLWGPIERTAAVVHFTAGPPEASSLSATIDMTQRTLTVHAGTNRSYVRAYPCAFGPDAAGLSGTYRIDAERGDTPRLTLVEPAGVWGKTSRLAVHAADGPAAFGGEAATGCVVIGRSDVFDLANFLKTGSTVTVVR